jgi:CBS domain-containing protein
MSVLIGVLCIAVAIAIDATGRFDLATAAVAWLGGINLLLALFNLMPGAPLDGGRVLTAILWWRSGDEQLARRRSANAGRVLGQMLIGLGILYFAFVGPTGLWTALVGWLIMSMARAEMLHSEMHDVLTGVRVADVMTTDLEVVRDDLMVGEFMAGPWPLRHVSSFPIVDAAGRPVGLLTLKRISMLPPNAWWTTPLLAIAVPASDLITAHPGDPLIDVLDAKQDPNARVLVTSGDRLVGIVSPTDVARTFERLSLVRRKPQAVQPGPVPPPPPPPPRPPGHGTSHHHHLRPQPRH